MIPWTNEDQARLKLMMAAGASVRRIAVALKRPSDDIKQRAKDLGLPFRNKFELAKEQGRLLGTRGKHGR
jgi:hypothetical protein